MGNECPLDYLDAALVRRWQSVALQWLCCHDLLEYVVAVDRICQVQLAMWRNLGP